MLLWFHASSVLYIDRYLHDLAGDWSDDGGVVLKGDGKPSTEAVKNITDYLSGAAGQLETQGMPVSADQLRKLVQTAQHAMSINGIQHGARSARSAFESELDSRKWLAVVPAERFKYLEADLPNVYGAEVAKRLEGARYDMAEASKCLALTRSTAAVGHMVKVIEFALRAYARRWQVKPDTTTGAPKNWRPLVDEIRASVRRTPSATSRQRAKLSDRILMLERFENIADLRHRTQHEGAKYTEEEADEVFALIRGFLSQLAKVW